MNSFGMLASTFLETLNYILLLKISHSAKEYHISRYEGRHMKVDKGKGLIARLSS